MDAIHKKVGKNLQAVRKSRGLSLDQVAELTGVSKAMIGQIERGDSNPTISVLWKIVNGLKISFTSLIEEAKAEVTFVDMAEIEPFLEEDGAYRAFPMFPFDQRKGFEMYAVNMDPGCSHESEPHNEAVEEYIVVTDGSLDVEIGGKTYAVSAGNAVRFHADRPHAYRNNTGQVTTYITLIHYPS
ncbi:helix-turn-helix domain-containing protein [Cohnella sp. GbtcB17]|uniref:helix-turn-helix domain-containing protein n=1 Tax=Cohnella sp. GbtcB17 TaxID=2824762 RepID=UPI001C30CDDC|nr:XRE family transcriptional regulator [Cohnella sp. GbtcB17]